MKFDLSKLKIAKRIAGHGSNFLVFVNQLRTIILSRIFDEGLVSYLIRHWPNARTIYVSWCMSIDSISASFENCSDRLHEIDAIASIVFRMSERKAHGQTWRVCYEIEHHFYLLSSLAGMKELLNHHHHKQKVALPPYFHYFGKIKANTFTFLFEMHFFNAMQWW